MVGPGRPPWPRPKHCYHDAPKVKPEAATAIVEFLMMGVRTPETCWATHKRQVINLRNCCIWLVDLFELYDDARTGKMLNCCIWSSNRGYIALFLQYLWFHSNWLHDWGDRRSACSWCLKLWPTEYWMWALCKTWLSSINRINHLNPELNPIC